jgi:two-component system chemotaxis response regulator CheB
MTATPVRAVVIEASLQHRGYLVRMLEAEGDICVVGQAVGMADAALLIRTLHPDVVILGIQATKADGQRAIGWILGELATPVLAMSSAVPVPISKSCNAAMDVITRPAPWTAKEEADVRRRVRVLRTGRPPLAPRKVDPRPPGVVAIAASTGGPNALADVVSGLAGVGAPVLIVQHIHADFVGSLTSWLGRVAAIPVRLAVHGERLVSGIAYVGPGDVHLKIDSAMRIALDPEPVSLHRPSADELFLSVARYAGAASVGVVLTGMGADGVRGLAALRAARGFTIAQDEATSAVFGMPQAAQLAGAVSRVLPLHSVAAAIVAATRVVHR